MELTRDTADLYDGTIEVGTMDQGQVLDGFLDDFLLFLEGPVCGVILKFLPLRRIVVRGTARPATTSKIIN